MASCSVGNEGIRFWIKNGDNSGSEGLGLGLKEVQGVQLWTGG